MLQHLEIARLYGSTTYLTYKAIEAGCHNRHELHKITGLSIKTLSSTLETLVQAGYVIRSRQHETKTLQHYEVVC